METIQLAVTSVNGGSEQKLVTTAFPAGSGPYTVLLFVSVIRQMQDYVLMTITLTMFRPMGLEVRVNWVTIGTFDEVTSMHAFRNREGYPNGVDINHGAWKVNGRLLIDGPADNSQVWSDKANTASGLWTTPPSTTFNGNISDYGVSKMNDNETIYLCTFSRN